MIALYFLNAFIARFRTWLERLLLVDSELQAKNIKIYNEGFAAIWLIAFGLRLRSTKPALWLRMTWPAARLICTRSSKW